jgi:hypothetical protein
VISTVVFEKLIGEQEQLSVSWNEKQPISKFLPLQLTWVQKFSMEEGLKKGSEVRDYRHSADVICSQFAVVICYCHL